MAQKIKRTANKRYIMKTNVDKTKTTLVGQITLPGENHGSRLFCTEQVSSRFCYLGQTPIVDNVKCDPEIKERIATAWNTFCDKQQMLS